MILDILTHLTTHAILHHTESPVLTSTRLTSDSVKLRYKMWPFAVIYGHQIIVRNVGDRAPGRGQGSPLLPFLPTTSTHYSCPSYPLPTPLPALLSTLGQKDYM